MRHRVSCSRGLRKARFPILVLAALLALPGPEARAVNVTFSPGDLFVSLETGPVQWRLRDGTLNRVLVGSIPGTGEGMAFDAAGNLYVTRWCIDPWCGYAGDTVEKFNTLGQSLGAVGSGYDCAPHAMLFDRMGAGYVGQAGCTGAILKFPPGMATPIAYYVAPDYQGSFWIDLAPDQCTMAYTSFGPNVKRFDVCAGVQLPDFNVAPLPGDGQDLRILPDGGVLVSSGDVIARLDASGGLVGTYGVVGEPGFWAGLDLVGDGSFWAANYETSNVYRFDLATGSIIDSFNAETPPHTVVGVRVRK
jgi:hypothetical protein